MMNKRFLHVLMIAALLLPAVAMAAGTVTVTTGGTRFGHRWINFHCVGDASNGTVPATTLTAEQTLFLTEMGLYPFRLIVTNDSGDTSVTDNSDVYLKDAGGQDFLNAQGVDALDDDTRNYIRLTQFDPVISPLVFTTVNQATVSGVWDVKIIFVQ